MFFVVVYFSQSLVDELDLLEEAASILGNTFVIVIPSVIKETFLQY